MRTVRILEAASKEAEASAEWYEYEQPGLGAEFFAAIDSAIDALEENLMPLSPVPGKAGKAGAKRLVLKRFPYDVVVLEWQEEAIVIAIAHHSRKPGYWQGRSKP